jgi:hypothetical protein
MSKSKIELIVVPVVLFFGIGYFMVALARANRAEFLAPDFALNNLRRINTALKEHATNASRKMPEAEDWADQVVAGEPCVLKGDFTTPYTYPAYGIFFNASFAGCDVSEIDANSVILFTCCEGRWNASGTRETFLRLSSKGRAYLITWDSTVYEYDSTTKSTRRRSDNTIMASNDLVWSKDRNR